MLFQREIKTALSETIMLMITSAIENIPMATNVECYLKSMYGNAIARHISHDNSIGSKLI